MRPVRLHSITSLRLALLALLAACAIAPAIASDPSAEVLPGWDQLTPAQRELLIAPVRDRWNSEPAQRARLLQHAQRWQQLTPDQRTRARHGMQHWEHLNPEQRARMRALFERMRGLDPDQRRALKLRWKEMTPEQQRAWVEANPPKARPLPPPTN